MNVVRPGIDRPKDIFTMLAHFANRVFNHNSLNAIQCNHWMS